MRVVDILDQHRRHSAKLPAVEDLSVSWTWEELAARAGGWAELLREAGVGRGDRVAVVAGNSAPLLALFYGAAAIGAAMVPLNPALTEAELAVQLGDAEPAVLLAEADVLPRVATAATRAGLGAPREFEQAVAALRPAPLPDEPAVTGEETFDIIYTSGSTGRPKGVCRSQHKTVLDGLQMGLALRMSPSDRLYLFLPLFHSGGFHSAQLAAMTGGTIVVRRGFSAEDLIAQLDAGVSVVMGVPAIWNDVVGVLEQRGATFPGLRVAYIAGSIAPRSLLERLGARFPGAGVYHAYGLTEHGPFVSVLAPELSDRHLGSIGRPLPNTRVAIRDDGGKELPPGEIGEITVAGPTVMDGYWRSPELTAIALPDGWLRTGDLGYLDHDGLLYIVDRKKDVIISKGETISSKEIEEALAAHEDVYDVAVIGVPHPDYEEMVAAVVQPREGVTVDEEQLTAHLDGRIARFKRPRRYWFVDEFPRTALGKINKPELRRRYAEPGEQRTRKDPTC